MIVKALIDIIQCLPVCNYVVARRVIGFLKKITEHAEANKMTSGNLATVITPNILYPRVSNDATLLQEMSTANQVVEVLIDYYSVIFRESYTAPEYHFGITVKDFLSSNVAMATGEGEEGGSGTDEALSARPGEGTDEGGETSDGDNECGTNKMDSSASGVSVSFAPGHGDGEDDDAINNSEGGRAMEGKVGIPTAASEDSLIRRSKHGHRVSDPPVPSAIRRKYVSGEGLDGSVFEAESSDSSPASSPSRGDDPLPRAMRKKDPLLKKADRRGDRKKKSSSAIFPSGVPGTREYGGSSPLSSTNRRKEERRRKKSSPGATPPSRSSPDVQVISSDKSEAANRKEEEEMQALSRSDDSVVATKEATPVTEDTPPQPPSPTAEAAAASLAATTAEAAGMEQQLQQPQPSTPEGRSPREEDGGEIIDVSSSDESTGSGEGGEGEGDKLPGGQGDTMRKKRGETTGGVGTLSKSGTLRGRSTTNTCTTITHKSRSEALRTLTLADEDELNEALDKAFSAFSYSGWYVFELPFVFFSFFFVFFLFSFFLFFFSFYLFSFFFFSFSFFLFFFFFFFFFYSFLFFFFFCVFFADLLFRVLVGYADETTLKLQATGSGSVAELAEYLDDTQVLHTQICFR